MTDNEIMRALECCIKHDCGECCLINYSDDADVCQTKLMKYALDLINRQKAEIERLKDFNENLQTANTCLSNEILDIKSEARKELAEKIKAKNGNDFLEEWHEYADIYYDFNQEEFEAYIDNLLGEMEKET